ncbi:hypothetical protein [Kribbella deserti]|uniref:Cbb3-type cytochrome oxidase assembly protein CcoS n=1 Tax=Kribbella deserti TaxID=1926257 RepID=A0ABV6QV86_9ACTN
MLTFVVTMIIVLTLATMVLLAVARGEGKDFADLRVLMQRSPNSGEKSA